MPILVEIPVEELAAPLHPGDHCLEDRRKSLGVRRGHQLERRLAEEIPRAVAENVADTLGACHIPALGIDLPDPVRCAQREVLQTPLAGAQRDLRLPARGDVAEREAKDGGALGILRGDRLDQRPDGGSTGPQQPHLTGLRLLGLPEHHEVPVVRVPVRREDEGAEWPPDEPLPLDAEQARGREVRFADDAVVAHGEVAHGRQVEEIEIARPRGFKLLLGAAQLLVLHLELDLVDAQLVDGGGELLEHGRGGRDGGEPAEALLGPAAQLGSREQLVGRPRRGLLPARLPWAGHQAAGSLPTVVSNVRRRFSGGSATVRSAVCMPRPLTSPFLSRHHHRSRASKLSAPQRRDDLRVPADLPRRPARQLSARREVEPAPPTPPLHCTYIPEPTYQSSPTLMT